MAQIVGMLGRNPILRMTGLAAPSETTLDDVKRIDRAMRRRRLDS